MDDGPAGWGLPLYRRVLDEVAAGPTTRLIDVGCGDGVLLRLAAERGAGVTGVDPDPARLARAAALVPAATLHRAPASALPLPGAGFTSLTCVQVLMHVSNPLAVLREMSRVATPGASVALTVWGPPERCALGIFGAALGPLLGLASGPAFGAATPRAGVGGPPPIGAEGRLARLAGLAGLAVRVAEDVRCAFDYPDQDTLLTSVTASELGRRARAVAGTRQVRRAVLAAVEPHRLPDGGYRLGNTFRLVVGAAPGPHG